MYETVPYTLSDIAMMYVIIVGASIVTYPLMSLFVKGVSKWK